MQASKHFFTFGWQRFFGRYSRILVSVFCGLVVAFGLYSLTLGSSTRVLVAVRDLPKGSLLTAADVQVVTWEGQVATDVLTVADSAVGERTQVSLVAQAPIRESYLQGGGDDMPAEQQRQRMTLAVSRPVAQMLAAGDRVDIYEPQVCEGAGACEARLVAHDVVVVQVHGAGSEGSVWGGGDGVSGSSLVLDVTYLEVRDLVGVVETANLRYILIKY